MTVAQSITRERSIMEPRTAPEIPEADLLRLAQTGSRDEPPPYPRDPRPQS
jgi:hypothetical protein